MKARQTRGQKPAFVASFFLMILLAPALWGQIEQGLASWYGEPFHGRRTASGEYYDMNKLTAAHKTLAFGTIVEVIDLATNRSVVVRITDRGPFVEGRIIDVSRAAAQLLDMTGRGVIHVSLRVLSGPPAAAGASAAPAAQSPNPNSKPSIQVGSFSSRVRAESFAARFKTFDPPLPSYVEDAGQLYRVLVAVPVPDEAAATLARIKNLGFVDAFIRR